MGQAVDSALESRKKKELVEEMDGKFHMSFGALGSTQTLDPTDSTDELILEESEFVCEIRVCDSFFHCIKSLLFLLEVFRQTQHQAVWLRVSGPVIPVSPQLCVSAKLTQTQRSDWSLIEAARPRDQSAII